MPCTTGRAMHQLCKSECPEECACSTVNAFSCRPYCFCEAQDDGEVHNQQKSLADVRVEICEVIDRPESPNLSSQSPFATVGDLQTYICERDYPHYRCPFTVSIQGASDMDGASGPTGTVGPYDVAVIDAGDCTPDAGTTAQALEAYANAYYDILIDGDLCTTFENN